MRLCDFESLRQMLLIGAWFTLRNRVIDFVILLANLAANLFEVEKWKCRSSSKIVRNDSPYSSCTIIRSYFRRNTEICKSIPEDFH